jgi:hypothetical protein
VVFRAAPSSANYNSITASLQAKDIMVEWSVGNQLNIDKYVVEKSTDNTNFYPVDTTNATTDTSSVYSWLDMNEAIGENFYRIRSVDNRDTVHYSKTVDVVITKPDSIAATINVNIYPNPVTDDILHIQMNNMLIGTYGIKILNSSGQILSTQTIQHSIVTEMQSILIPNNLSEGIYMLEIIDPNKKITKMNFKK